MKYTIVRFALAILLGAVVGSPASAGWGSLGGSHGGGSLGGGSYGGSSGGFAGYGSSGGVSYAGYGSSGGASVGGGSSGGYVAAYGSSGGAASSGGSSGHPGFLSRVASRIHSAHERIHNHFAAKHARHAGSSGGYVAHGSSGGSSGGYAYHGSTGGSSGGYVTGYSSVGGGSGSVSYGSAGSVSYGSVGSTYGSVGSSYGSAGSYHGASTHTASAASMLVTNSISEDAVQLNVVVPENAIVYVNDRPTKSTGELRKFVSRGLEAGKTYRFEIRAELNDNGKVVSDTKTIVATSGAQENIRFALKSAAPEKVNTAVVLNVPEDAEVTLAGNRTSMKGASRTFQTSQLKAGEVWDDYEIQVKVGEQVKKQTIRLIAGDRLELSFDFADNQDRLASR